MKCITSKPYWHVEVTNDGKRYSRYFKRDSDTIPQEAIDARNELKLKYHAEFASF